LMFSATRHSLSLTPNPLPYRISVRTNVVNLNRGYHKKVTALPFALSGDDAIRHVGPWASAGVRRKRYFRSLLAKHLPGLGFQPLQPDGLQAVYMPVWFIDGEVTGTINKSGSKESLVIHSLGSYMPGFSSDPLSTLPFNQPKLEELAVPFTPQLLHQHGLKISCIPYSISPASLPKMIKSTTSSQVKVSDSIAFDRKGIEFSMLAAYPVLLPVYLLRYDWTIDVVPQKLALTCIVLAHSKDPLVFLDAGTKAAGSLLRKNLRMRKGSMVHKLSHAADHMEIWDVISGTSYETFNVLTPSTNSVLDPTNKALRKFFDEKIQSKFDMAALARLGVHMDHPCVRMYTKDEVLANRMFMAASAECLSIRRFLDNVPFEEIARSTIIHRVNGRNPLEHEAIAAGLMGEMIYRQMRGRLPTAKKRREDLKPQWLRDWNRSQGQGRSAPL